MNANLSFENNAAIIAPPKLYQFYAIIPEVWRGSLSRRR